ncbi:hypothetical protein Gasu2_40550 [Galdieria sulphuraria]|nr:hypothetical protein Gasu2_40550 [Galdieria sulphuraria]
MLHDSDASTLAPESPLNTYESAKDTKAINLEENIKIRLRCKTNKTDFVDNCKSKNPKTLATSKKEPVQSNSTKYKNDSKSTNVRLLERYQSKEAFNGQAI